LTACDMKAKVSYLWIYKIETEASSGTSLYLSIYQYRPILLDKSHLAIISH
jgi:hypothetical protein